MHQSSAPLTLPNCYTRKAFKYQLFELCADRCCTADDIRYLQLVLIDDWTLGEKRQDRRNHRE